MELLCSALLFDLDGVLVDSSVVVARHWREWAERHDVSFEHLADVMHGRTSVETIRIVAPDLDAEHEARIREAREGDRHRRFGGLSRQRMQLLRSLPDRGWAVVTSGSLLHSRHPAASTEQFPKPPILVTAEDVQRGKPDPEAFLLAAKRLGVQPEQCVVIEDAPVGIEAARAAGMRVIGVATTHSPQALARADVIARRTASVTVRPKASQFRVRVESAQLE